jgi:hypothetical protein
VAGEQWDVVGGGRQRVRTKKEKEDTKRANSDQERRDPKRQDRMMIEKVMVTFVHLIVSRLLIMPEGPNSWLLEERVAQVTDEGQQFKSSSHQSDSEQRSPPLANHAQPTFKRRAFIQAYTRALPFAVARPATDLQIDAGHRDECAACARDVGDGSVVEREECSFRS